jgi:hypothetical protein
MQKIVLILFTFLFLPASFTVANDGNEVSGTLDLKKFADEVLDIYNSDEVDVKKERMVYKKLNSLTEGASYTMKVTCSDSIVYNKKEDITTVKSKEIYVSDSKTGYFGIFVIASQSGDVLLMNSTPDKEISITGKIIDIFVISYIKNKVNNKCYTPLKEFDDSGTIIQQVVFIVQM